MNASDLPKLAAPFPRAKAHWKIIAYSKTEPKGLVATFVDARDVMARLDDVCGIAGWQRRHDWTADGKTCASVGIKIDDEWVWKADGAGDTDIEGIKGAFSSAFKRAANNWGVGRYLYDLPSEWVTLVGEGKFRKIHPKEVERLKKLLPESTVVEDAEPENGRLTDTPTDQAARPTPPPTQQSRAPREATRPQGVAAVIARLDAEAAKGLAALETKWKDRSGAWAKDYGPEMGKIAGHYKALRNTLFKAGAA